MKKPLYLMAMIVCLLVSQFAFSQSDQQKERRVKAVLSNTVYRPINTAQEALQNQDFPKALEALDSLLARGERLKGFDRAKTLHLKTIVYIQQEDYPKAVETALEAIAVDALEIETQRALRYNVVSMLFVLERYESAIEQLEIWIAETDSLDAQASFTAAQLYLTVENIQKALYYAEQGMEKHRADTTAAPKENWYRLLLSIYGREKLFDKAAVVAEQLLSYWPAKLEYYHQLSGLFQQLDRQEDAWIVLDIAFHNNLITKNDDHVRLLQMHRFFGYPYRGATIFQTAMRSGDVEENEKNWESLANAWLQSRQWRTAETALSEAAQLSDSGKHWFRLCQTAFQNERWQASKSYCQNAMDKGELKEDQGATWQLMAMVHVSLNDYPSALQYFRRCETKSDTQKDCVSWLKHVNDLVAFEKIEKERKRTLAEEAENRRRDRDSIINQALMMTDQ